MCSQEQRSCTAKKVEALLVLPVSAGQALQFPYLDKRQVTEEKARAQEQHRPASMEEEQQLWSWTHIKMCVY